MKTFAIVLRNVHESDQIRRAAAITPAIMTEPVSRKSRHPNKPEVGADVLLELGGGPEELEEAAGALEKVVLLGVEPLPPILVLLVVAVEGAAETVVSRVIEDVAVSITSPLFDKLTDPVAADLASEATELISEATELATDEAPDLRDDAPLRAAEASEVAAEIAFDTCVDTVMEVAEIVGFVKGTIGIGTTVGCVPIVDEAADAMLVASDIDEPATFDATMLSCTAADLAALDISAAETEASVSETSDIMDAVVGTTILTGATVTGSFGADTVAGSWIDVLKPLITTGANGA